MSVRRLLDLVRGFVLVEIVVVELVVVELIVGRVDDVLLVLWSAAGLLSHVPSLAVLASRQFFEQSDEIIFTEETRMRCALIELDEVVPDAVLPDVPVEELVLDAGSIVPVTSTLWPTWLFSSVS